MSGIPLRLIGWLSLLFSLPNEVPPYFVMISAIKEAIYRSDNSVFFSLAKISRVWFQIQTSEKPGNALLPSTYLSTLVITTTVSIWLVPG